MLGVLSLFPQRQITLQHHVGLQSPGLAPRKVTDPRVMGPAGASGELAPKWGRRGCTGGGSSAPPYPAAVQALQVDDEWLIVFLALGDFGERSGSLAQQLLLRQLVNTGEEILLETQS